MQARIFFNSDNISSKLKMVKLHTEIIIIFQGADL